MTTLSPYSVGQRGNAQIHLAAQRLDLDAAVLRQPALGDVQLGHQLDARDHGGLQFARRRVLIVEHAIHAIADAEFFFERLQVDVAGALFNRGSDDRVHQADDGRFARHVAQVFQIFRHLAGLELEIRLGARGRFAVVFVDGVDDLLLGREHGADLETGAVAHGGDGFDIQRIGHRERDGMIFAAHRQAAELPQEARRERFGFGRDEGRGVDGNQRHFQLFRERRQNIAHGDETHVDQRFADLVAALFLQLERPLQVFLGDQLTLDQNLA